MVSTSPSSLLGFFLFLYVMPGISKGTTCLHYLIEQESAGIPGIRFHEFYQSRPKPAKPTCRESILMLILWVVLQGNV